MKKNKVILATTLAIAAISATSCSTSSQAAYSKEQFVGIWNHSPKMPMVQPFTTKVVNKADGTSKSTISDKKPLPSGAMAFPLKLKKGETFMTTKWDVQGKTFSETTSKGKTFSYKIKSVTPDQYVLENKMGTEKVYTKSQ